MVREGKLTPLDVAEMRRPLATSSLGGLLRLIAVCRLVGYYWVVPSELQDYDA